MCIHSSCNCSIVLLGYSKAYSLVLLSLKAFADLFRLLPETDLTSDPPLFLIVMRTI